MARRNKTAPDFPVVKRLEFFVRWDSSVRFWSRRRRRLVVAILHAFISCVKRGKKRNRKRVADDKTSSEVLAGDKMFAAGIRISQRVRRVVWARAVNIWWRRQKGWSFILAGCLLFFCFVSAFFFFVFPFVAHFVGESILKYRWLSRQAKVAASSY